MAKPQPTNPKSRTGYKTVVKTVKTPTGGSKTVVTSKPTRRQAQIERQRISAARDIKKVQATEKTKQVVAASSSAAAAATDITRSATKPAVNYTQVVDNVVSDHEKDRDKDSGDSNSGVFL